MGKVRTLVEFNTSGLVFDTVRAKKVLDNLALNESVQIKMLHYNFVSREIIRAMNVTHLQHDYVTDIITFDYSDGKGIVGEIYMCPEVITDNALNLGVSLKDEMMRVVIHGLLHLIGYNDQTPEERAVMRRKEDEYLYKVLAV